MRGERRRFAATEDAKRRLLQAFTAALEARDEKTLLALFAPDATWTADGGGKFAAAPQPIVGAERIVRLVLDLREKFWPADRVLEPRTVNGEPGLWVHDGDRSIAAMAVETDGERIVAVYAVLNPEKLAAPVTTVPPHGPGLSIRARMRC